MWAWYWLHFVESRGPVLWRCVDVLRGPVSWKSVGLELWPCVDTCHGHPGHNASWSHVWTPTPPMWPRALSASTLLVHAAAKWARSGVLIKYRPQAFPQKRKKTRKERKNFLQNFLEIKHLPPYLHQFRSPNGASKLSSLTYRNLCISLSTDCFSEYIDRWHE